MRTILIIELVTCLWGFPWGTHLFITCYSFVQSQHALQSRFPFFYRLWRGKLFSNSVVWESLQPHGLQHTSLPCHSLFPGVCSNWRPLSQWCHPTVSSSVTLFSSCPQSFPVSGSFPVSWLFASGGQSIRASASASIWRASSTLKGKSTYDRAGQVQESVLAAC